MSDRRTHCRWSAGKSLRLGMERARAIREHGKTPSAYHRRYRMHWKKELGDSCQPNAGAPVTLFIKEK